MNRAEEKSDKGADLFPVRSVLFLPASNPRAIAKARTLAADLVILDLEDAVAPGDKDEARRAAVDAVASDWPMPVAIRVNGAGTDWHSPDLDAVASSAASFVTVPRAASAHLVHDVRETTDKPVLAMIETAAGVLAAAEIAEQAAALIAGTNDLRADLRLPLDGGRESISASLQLIILAARAGGIPAFDGVFNKLDDTEGFSKEALAGRQLGFDGKSLIHPNQIAHCHEAFAPSAAEIERANALIDAFHGGAERFGNEMIERMHVEAAQRVLDRART
ncbi:MAG TPA: CoA ester lyase [Sphingomicrobium sp.]|nr:CoA ester lyase [Sphingomicrobium sp.]